MFFFITIEKLKMLEQRKDCGHYCCIVHSINHSKIIRCNDCLGKEN